MFDLNQIEEVGNKRRRKNGKLPDSRERARVLIQPSVPASGAGNRECAYTGFRFPAARRQPRGRRRRITRDREREEEGET